MKIALVCWGLSPPFGTGGVSRYVNRIANAIGRMGHEVVVFYAYGYDKKESSDLFEAVKIPTSRIPVVRLFQYCHRLNKTIPRFDFDVINVHIPPLAWSLEADCPIVLTAHTTSSGEADGIVKGGFHSLLDLAYLVVFKTIGQAMENSILNRSCSVVVVNPFIGDEISKRRPLLRERIHVLDPAIEPKDLRLYAKPQARESLGIGISDFVVLYVGRLETRKNPLVLLDGFASVVRKERRPLRLIFCGDGNLRGSLKDRVNQLGLGGCVAVLGQVSEQTLSLAYSAADVYCLPSEMEGFPVTLIESRFFGLPVIVGPFPGVGRIVKDRENGIVLNVVTPDSIADALELVLSSSDDLKKMAQANAAAYSDTNSWKTVAGMMCKLYEQASRECRTRRI